MKLTRTSIARPLRRLPLILAATLPSLAALPAQAAEMRWTATSYAVKFDPASGDYQRRGLAVFPNGEIAAFTMEGRVLTGNAPRRDATVRIVYTFEDGSTLVQEGMGRTEMSAAARSSQTGQGRLISGTGRYAGISGTTSSTGVVVTPQDQYTEFKAEYTLPAK